MRNVLNWVIPCGSMLLLTLSLQAESLETVPPASNASSVPVSTATCRCHAACEVELVTPCRLGQRLPPPGDLHPRYPYATFRMNYYDRPYGPGQESTAMVPRTGTVGLDPQPYRTRLFDELEAKFTQKVTEDASLNSYYLEAQGAKTAAAVHDGYLEYQDWRRHRDARLEWEKRQQSEEELPHDRSTRRITDAVDHSNHRSN